MAYLLRGGARVYTCSNTPAWTVASYSTRSVTTHKTRKWLTPTLAAVGVATFAGFLLSDEEDTAKVGEQEPELPTFSMRQVQEQTGRAWVVYRHGVYDVTDFAGDHPGGRRILQAAGKSVEIFWQHSEPHSRAGAPETLEELRIGNLKQEDFDWMEEVREKSSTSVGDRDSGSSALQQLFFFERASSLPAPKVDLGAFELKICGGSELDGREEISLSLADLKTRFKQRQVTTTIRCATPRTAGPSTDKAVTRAPAEWAGVLLVDVLASVGISTTAGVEQVRIEALDTDGQGKAFGTSIPAVTALDRDIGVLLAYEMNGEPIPKEHGFPLRVVVPGATGARNVKFVHRIILT